MRVHIEQDWQLDGFKIWFYERMGATLTVLQFFPDGGTRWVPDEDDHQAPPSLVLREEMLRVLLEEAGKVIPATHATERHLNREIEMVEWLKGRVEELLPE